MPFYRCMPRSSGNNGDHCGHITINYINEQYEVPLFSNVPIYNMSMGECEDNVTFNCPINIGSAMKSAENLLQYYNNFNSYINMQNADNLRSVANMIYLCNNYNQPTIFPKNIYNYYMSLRRCRTYNQPTEIFINCPDSAEANLAGMFMESSSINSKITISLQSENSRNCDYTSFLYGASSFNQPLILKGVTGLNFTLNSANNMNCPIVVDFSTKYPNLTTGNNTLWGARVDNIIVLNYVNQAIKWDGTLQDVTFYVNDPYTFVNRCTRLYRQGVDKYSYIPIENGLQADVRYNIRVLYNVSDGLNYFNNVWHSYYNEYPEY